MTPHEISDFCGLFSLQCDMLPSEPKPNNTAGQKHHLTDQSGNIFGVVFHFLPLNEEEQTAATLPAAIDWQPTTLEMRLHRPFPGFGGLFYLVKDQDVYFASSMSLLLEITRHIPKNLNLNAILEVAMLGRLCAPTTQFDEIKSLPAGASIHFNFKTEQLKASDLQRHINADNIADLLYGGIRIGEDNQQYACPFIANADGKAKDTIVSLAESTNADLYRDFPQQVYSLDEPIADVGFAIFDHLLQNKNTAYYWHFASDWISKNDVLDKHYQFVLANTHSKLTQQFTAHWLEQRYPALCAELEPLRSDFPELSTDSLIGLTSTVPERLRHTREILRNRKFTWQWDNRAFSHNLPVLANVEQPFPQSFFSDRAYEACNLYSQFTFLNHAGVTLYGDKITDLFALSMFDIRRLLRKISLSDKLRADRLLLAIMSTNLVWKFH